MKTQLARHVSRTLRGSVMPISSFLTARFTSSEVDVANQSGFPEVFDQPDDSRTLGDACLATDGDYQAGVKSPAC